VRIYEEIKKHQRINVSIAERNIKILERMRDSANEKALKAEPKTKEPVKEQAPEQKPLIISDVQPALIDEEVDDLPWFEDAKGNRKCDVPKFIGMHENIPCVLVMTIYGRHVPAYLIPGFIGMFPKSHQFPEHEPEQQPKEEQPINASTEPIISPLEEEHREQVITHAPEQKKNLYLPDIRKEGRKDNPNDNHNLRLSKQIINASKDEKNG